MSEAGRAARQAATQVAPLRLGALATALRGAARSSSRWLREGLLFLAIALLTAAALWAVFPPRTIWPLAFVALVPWVVATCRSQRPSVVYAMTFVTGYAFFFVSLLWLQPVTGVGFAALAFYLAIYWPAAAWAIRTGRRAGISVVWSVPVVWVACEYLRAWVMSGFPWLFVGHGFYAMLPFIQIADVFGAYGVSFVALFVNGAIAAWALRYFRTPSLVRIRRWQPIAGSVAAVGAVAGTLVYGNYRLGYAAFEEGPRVAVVQEDFPYVSTPPYGAPPHVIFARYLAMAAAAAAESPDLIALPETAWNSYQNLEFLSRERRAVDDVPAFAFAFGRRCHVATASLARGDYGPANSVLADFERPGLEVPGGLPSLNPSGGPPVTVLLGAVSVETYPEQTNPRMRRFNSALVYDPDGQQRVERYDKMHLVPFGEFVPFRNASLLGVSMHWLYVWLNALSPFSDDGKVEYSLSPGSKPTVFDLEANGRTYKFGTPICYEGVMPYVIRNFVWDQGRKRVDFLVNISNDAWFQYSDELPQHLAAYAFRAVENRVSIARAVNTGISGFIDSDGRIHDLVEAPDRRYGPGIVGYRIAAMRLDDRATFYGRYGDWFAQLCLLLASGLWFYAIASRWLLAAQIRIRRFMRKGAT